jgi:hypothetical protein
MIPARPIIAAVELKQIMGQTRLIFIRRRRMRQYGLWGYRLAKLLLEAMVFAHRASIDSVNHFKRATVVPGRPE